MSNPTDAALRATRAIEQLGGLQRAVWGASGALSANDIAAVLETCARLKLEVPATLTEDLERAAMLFQRVHKLRTKPGVFTSEDLAAKDFEDRFTAAVVARARTNSDDLIKATKAQLVAELGSAVRGQAQALIELLNSVYAEHAEAEHHGSGPGIHLAHQMLLGWQGGVGLEEYAGQWCLLWSWSATAWAELVENSGPELATPHGWHAYDFAVACGAEPRLALSRHEAREAGRLNQDANRVLRMNRHAEQQGAAVQDVIAREVAQAKRDSVTAEARQAAIAQRLASA